MKVKDREAWQRFCAKVSRRQYEQAILNYAIRWADNRMLTQIGKGKPLEEVVETTMDESGMKLSNIQIAQAIAILINHWERGEELKDWFNKRWAIVREARERSES